MHVLEKFPVDFPEAVIEVGFSTWDRSEISIRLRFDKNGRFDPRSSSEIPLIALPSILKAAIGSEFLTKNDALKMAKTLIDYGVNDE